MNERLKRKCRRRDALRLVGGGEICCKACKENGLPQWPEECLDIDHIDGVLTKFGKYYERGCGRGREGTSGGAAGSNTVKEVLDMHYAGEDVTKYFQCLCVCHHRIKTLKNKDHRPRNGNNSKKEDETSLPLFEWIEG